MNVLLHACRQSAAGALLLLALSVPLNAQRHGGPAHPGLKTPEPKTQPEAESEAPPLERFAKMTPEQREQVLAKLPPNRREKLMRQLDRYNQMSPAERERLDWFQRLPPERQEAFRKAFQKFQREPPERQEVMKDALGRLRGMSDAERQAYVSSPEVKARFNKNEQQVLEQLSGILPHND